MKLRTQMLLAGALTLAIPIVGWQSVKQLDASLQQTRIDAQTLKVANARVALAEAGDLQKILNTSVADGSDNDFYAEAAAQPMFVDGYADDWREQRAGKYRFSDDDRELSVQFAQRDRRLFVYMVLKDHSVVYHNPPTLKIDFAEGEQPDEKRRLINGDAIELLIVKPEGDVTHALFRAIAPGPINGLVASRGATSAPSSGVSHVRQRRSIPGRTLPGYRGAWVSRNDGFQLELGMPQPPLGSTLAINFIDVDEPDGKRQGLSGLLSSVDMARIHGGQQSPPDSLPKLYFAPANARARLAPWVTSGVRARVFDSQGFLVADVNSLYEKSPLQQQLDPAKGSFFNAVLFRLFAYFVSGDSELDGAVIVLEDDLHLQKHTRSALSTTELPTSRYVTTERDRVLGTLVAIGGDEPNGYLLFESNEELAASYASSRLARLFSLLTLVSLLAGGILFLFASLLSLRIRKLSKQASLAVAEDGRVTGLSSSSARDEIGDLSRNLSALLSRSANYTQYLEALSSRLSHELRTPLSVVKTSIENMDRDRLDSDTQRLLDRASGGADQLGSIIRALVESTRLEQTVQNAQMSMIDMAEWMQGSLARYSQVYPHIEFLLSDHIEGTLEKVNIPAVSLIASPELLQQALDKLVDNAVEFCTDGPITLVLASGARVPGNRDQARSIKLMVVNEGPQIPADRVSKLFDPMFSSRIKVDDTLHLGLGLYIVRMIAEAHGGQPIALNVPRAVAIGFSLPVA